MNNLNIAFDLDKFRTYLEENRKTVRMVALIMIVGLSILFFWIHGDSRTIEMDEADGTDAYDTEGGEYNDLYMTEESTGDMQAYGEVTAPVSGGGASYVDISGEVNNPGVYKVSSDTRLFQVIEMAGGLTEKADPNSLNRAERVSDGQKIIVRAYGEEGESTVSSSYEGSEESSAGGRVNINLADLSELQTLPGIGPAKAQSIISYREQNGYYTAIEEIMYVDGIGEKTFASIKDMISV